jgi:hypothetical protein
MRHHHPAILALVMMTVCVSPLAAQRGGIRIPSPPSVPAPRVMPVPHGVPHTDRSQGGGDGVDPLVILGCIAGAAALGVAGFLGVRAWRNRTVGHVRVVHTPPGEAPEDIRRAWVGVELPLNRRSLEPQPLPSVGVLSQQGILVAPGYFVEGRKAVAALADHDSAAADWWRQNAPHVLAKGYPLFFPENVCERTW